MVNIGVIGVGVGLLIIAGIGYFTPTGPNGYTTPQLNALCDTGYFESAWVALGGKMMFGENYEQLIKQDCANLKLMTIAIYGLVIAGVATIAAAAVEAGLFSTKNKELDILKEKFANGEISKEELEQMKKDLEKS